MKIRFTSQHHKSQGRNIGPDAPGLDTGGVRGVGGNDHKYQAVIISPWLFCSYRGTTLIYMGIIFINQHHNFGGSLLTTVGPVATTYAIPSRV